MTIDENVNIDENLNFSLGWQFLRAHSDNYVKTERVNIDEKGRNRWKREKIWGLLILSQKCVNAWNCEILLNIDEEGQNWRRSENMRNWVFE